MTTLLIVVLFALGIQLPAWAFLAALGVDCVWVAVVKIAEHNASEKINDAY